MSLCCTACRAVRRRLVTKTAAIGCRGRAFEWARGASREPRELQQAHVGKRPPKVLGSIHGSFYGTIPRQMQAGSRPHAATQDAHSDNRDATAPAPWPLVPVAPVEQGLQILGMRDASCLRATCPPSPAREPRRVLANTWITVFDTPLQHTRYWLDRPILSQSLLYPVFLSRVSLFPASSRPLFRRPCPISAHLCPRVRTSLDWPVFSNRDFCPVGERSVVLGPLRSVQVTNVGSVLEGRGMMLEHCLGFAVRMYLYTSFCMAQGRYLLLAPSTSWAPISVA